MTYECSSNCIQNFSSGDYIWILAWNTTCILAIGKKQLFTPKCPFYLRNLQLSEGIQI